MHQKLQVISYDETSSNVNQSISQSSVNEGIREINHSNEKQSEQMIRRTAPNELPPSYTSVIISTPTSPRIETQKIGSVNPVTG